MAHLTLSTLCPTIGTCNEDGLRTTTSKGKKSEKKPATTLCPISPPLPPPPVPIPRISPHLCLSVTTPSRAPARGHHGCLVLPISPLHPCQRCLHAAKLSLGL